MQTLPTILVGRNYAYSMLHMHVWVRLRIVNYFFPTATAKKSFYTYATKLHRYHSQLPVDPSRQELQESGLKTFLATLGHEL